MLAQALPPPTRPPEVYLERTAGCRGPKPREIDAIVSSLHSKPYDLFVFPTGPVAAKLLYRRRSSAIAALGALWRRRLDGDLPLEPHILPSDDPEVDRTVKPLFVARLLTLLNSELVKKCEKMIDKGHFKVNKLSDLLRKARSFKLFEELKGKKRRAEAEVQQVRKRLDEFREGIWCLLEMLGEKKEGPCEEERLVVVLNIGEGLDWNRAYYLMVRECRRLEEGLPIYSRRREILQSVLCNQVMVLIGETGSGKSTQLIQFIADSGLAANGSIVCTQPRKIAALSLARRVGEESDGCYADNSVISYPTYYFSQEFTSKIVFVTDHCLLQHCMNDSGLAGVSYVIVDEAHERSLNTDLLLAIVKNKLPERPDLRLIIMSATADGNKFSNYFYGCCRFNVIGRTFPVEIRYIPDLSVESLWMATTRMNFGNCASYVSDVVKMVNVIHKREKDGGILAFLTSQMEVEWACENFHDPSAEVLPMHGKLSYEQQNCVIQNFPGKRKVIFSTNVAETSLTIPGIKYVVDSGMVKDCRFESSTGMNVLKVSWTTQSSAKQRAGRAGRTEPGICYRLYSESDFKSMMAHQEPEIRKVHLGIAILRILALGFRNVQDFDFVDSPSLEAIDTAVQNLIRLGAIMHKKHLCEITDTGRSLVKLDLEPRLGKIILDCFSFGLGKEGLVLAAVMANSSSIFCRVGTQEEKLRADCRKLAFCHPDGDLFTLLSVYKEWEGTFESRSRWCWQNSINAQSMRRCQETVLELEARFHHEFDISTPNYWSWNPHRSTKHDTALKKVIFSSLAENLTMYSGYDRLGYEVALTGQYFQLHPSCSLLVNSNKPNWVVFGDILSSSNQYLICVTAVDHESFYCIQPSLFDISQLESHKMQMNVITGAGVVCLRRLCGKQNHNIKHMISHIQKVCMDSRIGIEVDFDKREIQLFSSEKDMEKVCTMINGALQHETRWIMDECTEKCLFHGGPGTSSSVALLGCGAEIKHLELENRYLTVEISHPHAQTMNDKEILVIIEQNVAGIANYFKQTWNPPEGVNSSKWGRVTFLTPEAAEDAVAKLNKLEVHGSLLSVVPVNAVEYRNMPSAVRAKVCWPRRYSKGVALIMCADGVADLVFEDLCDFYIQGQHTSCEVSTKYKNCVVVFRIPRDVSEPELCDAVLSRTKRRIISINLLRGEAVDKPPRDFAELLVKEITPFMPRKHFKSFNVEVFNPEPKDHMMKAVITFDGSLHLEAAKALDHIQGKVLSGCHSWQKIECQHVFHTSVSCSARVYSVVKKQVDSLVGSFKHQKGVSCTIEKNDDGSIRVKISASATKIVADLRKPLEQLIKGKIVNHPSFGPTLLQLLLSREGTVLMKAVERETGTFILYERQKRNVLVFGSPKDAAAAEEKLIASLITHHENRPLDIHVKGRALPPDLMKEVIQRFGPDLHEFKAMVPDAKIDLNTRYHFLSVRGSKEQKQIVQNAISSLAQSLNNHDVVCQASEEALCPICLCDLEEPYKLELCGHDFCRSCLVEQLESAIRSQDGFPICCTKDGCRSPVVLYDLKSLLPVSRMDELFTASLSAFVASSGGTYRFCPSPDCPGIYRVAPQDVEVRPFVCGACSAETCTKCHLEYHAFVSCDLYRHFKEDPDISLEVWRKGKEHVKDCPSCGHTIEKTDGCDHIECRCGRHICWVCLESFTSSGDCYSHLRSIHQDII